MSRSADHRTVELRRFSMICPDCGGEIYRDLTWWEQVCFFLPVHFFVKAHYRCTRCKARFHSGPGVVDFVLSPLFIGVHFLLLDYLWITPVFLGGWLLLTLWHGSGPIHLFIATEMLAALWFIALVLNDLFPWMLEIRISDTPVGFLAMVLAAPFLGYFILYLDGKIGGKLDRPQ